MIGIILAQGVYRLVTAALQWRHNERHGVSYHCRPDCFLNCLFRISSKKTSKLRATGLCEGNSPVTGEFPAQRASNAEDVSIWWRHHGFITDPHSCHGLLKCSGTSELLRSPHRSMWWNNPLPLCDVKACPLGCKSLGYCAQCRDDTFPFVPRIETPNMEFLSFGYPSMQIPNLHNITLQSQLLILDKSNSVIIHKCDTFSGNAKFYQSIIILRLQFNNITSVSSRCFFPACCTEKKYSPLCDTHCFKLFLSKCPPHHV